MAEINPGSMDEPRIDIPEQNRFLVVIKNILVFLILLLVVAVSFWISFQLGKRILMPAKKITEPRITAPIPEAPPSIKALQAAMSREAVKKAAPVQKPALQKRKVRRLKAVRCPTGRHYFKLQAGLSADKAGAEELAGKMKEAGADVFIKKVRGGWRVQAGAFKTKAQAAAAQSALDKKGYKSKIIFE